jgi:hypothetical protein
MILLSIFSGALFVLPVAVTGGLYVGLQHQKVIDAVHGKPPPNSNPDGTPRVVETTQYCQKAYGIDPYPFRYTCTYFQGFYPRHSTVPNYHATLQRQLFSWIVAISASTSSQAYQVVGWDPAPLLSKHCCFPCAIHDSVGSAGAYNCWLRYLQFRLGFGIGNPNPDYEALWLFLVATSTSTKSLFHRF